MKVEPWVNDDATLLSLLYDLDLMPEQVKEGTRQFEKMQTIIAHWKVAKELKQNLHLREK